MISNSKNTSQQTKQRQFNNCLHQCMIRNSSLNLDSTVQSHPSLESSTSKMSKLSAAVKPPMEGVVVNSIVYSKPSFCRISVDLGNVPVDKNPTPKTKLTNRSSQNHIKCFSETICSSMDLRNSDFNFDVASCLAGLATTSSLEVSEDVKLYRMCTTMNGSIQHQISDLCDNILAMAEIFTATNNENDDDSFIEFAYTDSDDNYEDEEEDEKEEDEDDCDEDEDDFVDNEDDYEYEVDDDNDVVDFSYDCLIKPAPNLNCDQRKKVRFNTKPTVHVMHTWKYAYHAARKGEWEMYARDRERFKLRIQRTALTLNPILEREHRQKIYGKRFANIYNCVDDRSEVQIDTESNTTSNNIESKKPHQKKKRKKRRFCKMGNKHYF